MAPLPVGLLVTAPSPQRSAGSWTPAWLALLALCVVLTGAIDTTLLALSTGFFGSGFNSEYIDGFAQYAGFGLASLVLDLALVLGLWSLCVPLLRLARGSALQVWVVAGALATGVPLLVAAARYNLYSTLGQKVSVSLLRDTAGGSSSAMAAQALEQVEVAELLVPWLLVVALLVASVAARRLEKRLPAASRLFAPPRTRSLWAAFAVCAALSTLVLALPSSASLGPIQYGLRLKPARLLLLEVVRRATDVDGDGFGWLSEPADPAPFDGRVHPYAVDVPGNGIDENGVAGDHPADFPAPPSASPGPAAALPAGAATPHVLVVFLETFRADLLGLEIGGREVTPFLNRLAREGAATELAYVHCPSTVPSRAHLLTGELAYRAATSSLIDDFHARGYTVAYFSGQDESFGNTEALLGLDRADVFYDARQDVERRTSRSASTVSLQVSWKLLLERVGAFLDGADPDRPLFLYVNFVDAHFPYFHDELDRILDVEPIGHEDLRADRAEAVFRGYANTAANVDRAVERLVGAWRAHFAGRDQAILVTADHGQAFYERGFLGHGQSLDDTQTHIPFILWGVGGEWPEPLGLADVRGLLARNLFAPRGDGVPVAHFAPEPGRRVLQWVANLQHPQVIGLRGVDGLARYDLGRGELVLEDAGGSETPLPPETVSERVLEVVRRWEAVQQRQIEGRQG